MYRYVKFGNFFHAYDFLASRIILEISEHSFKPDITFSHLQTSIHLAKDYIKQLTKLFKYSRIGYMHS